MASNFLVGKTTKKKPKKGQPGQQPKTKQQLEQDRVAHRKNNNNHVSINTKPLSSSLWSRLLPRHLDPEPTVTVVRTYSPDEEGIFLGLRVLVFCENYFFHKISLFNQKAYMIIFFCAMKI